MINLTFPDGSIKQFQSGVTGEEVAASIAISLRKNALAIKLDQDLQDIYLPITRDAKIEIITSKSPEGLEIIRHDTAHILAQAVKDLYPEAQITIGPVIENGFYYDIAYDQSFTPADLELIEKRMWEICKANYEIKREVWNRDEAVRYFESIGEKYKAEIIRDIDKDQEISLYKQGDFMDLCRGPHAPSTGKAKAFKLLKLAGAYWRGDSRNPMLQRIYGTAWASEEDLEIYLHRLEEAEKRDHRRIGKEMDLFHLQEEASGMVFWHSRGWTIYQIIQQYLRDKLKKYGYTEVKTPILVNRELWENSGHWEKFGHAMFTSENEGNVKALKPMNCPCHVQIFNNAMRSYRDLPLRMAEFGTCHRNEPSGSLHGIMRVREFIQDDAHIFCAEDDITSETIQFCNLLQEVYQDFGFSEVSVKFADRPEVRAGSDEIWDKAEAALKTAVEAAGLAYEVNPGEGAFYGPKLEFHLTDAIGRTWQCGTLQVDFVLPERLKAYYIGPDGNKHHPVMLHRAILGSIERFIGILIEEYKGRFPLWLAPIQLTILSITEAVDDYIHEIAEKLETLGIRAELDLSNEKINYKIRKHSMQKTPLLLVIGQKERDTKTVVVRKTLDASQETMDLKKFLLYIEKVSKLNNI